MYRTTSSSPNNTLNKRLPLNWSFQVNKSGLCIRSCKKKHITQSLSLRHVPSQRDSVFEHAMALQPWPG